MPPATQALEKNVLPKQMAPAGAERHSSHRGSHYDSCAGSQKTKVLLEQSNTKGIKEGKKIE
jgi:hypothetical protein